MVRFVDLEEHDFQDATSSVHRMQRREPPPDVAWHDDHHPNAHFPSKLSVILSIYPIISQLVQYVDLNTLHELSRTCRQFRENLLQHRNLLMEQTLRCVNERADFSHRLGAAFSASVHQWKASSRADIGADRIASGRVITCARDMVGPCRRCGDVVCRNCAIKQPSIRDVKSRHRRLCRACMKCPLNRLTVTASIPDHSNDPAATAYSREPCDCEQHGVWICEPCGQLLRSANTTYLRGWAWRARYSACGGVGAGLGEGNEGVECGRAGACLAADVIVSEIECDADELAAQEAETEKTEVDGRHWAGNSYTTHEIVGLGGKVKKKIKKKVLIGAIVKEYEDERVAGKLLRKEQEGTNRSWCGWCLRVVPGKKDGEQPSGSTDSISSTDSASAS